LSTTRLTKSRAHNAFALIASSSSWLLAWLPEQVFDALKIVLKTFDSCGLAIQLDCFAYSDPGDREQGRQLLRAFNLVGDWCSCPNLDPGAIRDCLTYSDHQWERDWPEQSEAA
jgi:hypothetical protein